MSAAPEKLPVNDEAIEAMAASWLVQKDEGFSAAQAAEFARWCSASPRHAAAVALLEETCGILESLPLVRDRLPLGPPAAGRQSEEMPASRRRSQLIPFPRIAKIAAAIAACLLVGAGIAWQQRDRVELETAYATAAGGFQRVVLPDASVIQLNAATDVRVRYSKATRRLTLARGEAHFSVAKNPARPFIVEVGHVAVRAVGTAFNVRFDATGVDVLVTEGRVEVSRSDATPRRAAEPGTFCSAGEHVLIANDSAPAAQPAATKIEPAAVRDALAWQAPLLVFADRPLGDVILEFNRYNRVQLSIADPALAQRAVDCTFRADQVETFVRLLEESRDVHAEHPSADRIVLHRVAR